MDDPAGIGRIDAPASIAPRSARGNVVVALIAALICALSVTARIVVLSTAVPAPLMIFGQSDVFETWRQTHLEGHRIPYLDVPFWYPPVIGYVSGAISLVVTTPRGYLIGWGIVMVLTAAALGFILSRAAGPRRTLLYFAAAPQLLLLSGINFDLLPAALATAAVLHARGGRSATALAYAAVGAATKFYSLAFAPIELLRASRISGRRAVVAAVTFAAVFAVTYLPAIVAPYSQLTFTAEYAYQVGPNFDSIWRLPYLMFLAAGLDANTLVLAITTAGMGLTYLLMVIPRALRARDPAVGFALAVVTILLWNRFYSPQYEIWLLPFFVLLPIPGRTFAILSIADVTTFAAVYTMTLVLHPADPLLGAFAPVMMAAVALRHVALVLLWRDVSRLAAPR